LWLAVSWSAPVKLVYLSVSAQTLAGLQLLLLSVLPANTTVNV